jgi:hypothetical protein
MVHVALPLFNPKVFCAAAYIGYCAQALFLIFS